MRIPLSSLGAREMWLITIVIGCPRWLQSSLRRRVACGAGRSRACWCCYGSAGCCSSATRSAGRRAIRGSLWPPPTAWSPRRWPSITSRGWRAGDPAEHLSQRLQRARQSQPMLRCGQVGGVSAGRFLDARDPKSGALNEANTIVIQPDEPGIDKVVVRQIAGLIARRIVCTVKPGDRVERGQRIGLIKFGSRTELIIAGRAPASRSSRWAIRPAARSRLWPAGRPPAARERSHHDELRTETASRADRADG